LVQKREKLSQFLFLSPVPLDIKRILGGTGYNYEIEKGEA
jgi:hypothetical protein